MVPPKKKSKRVSVRLRHKIEKRSAEKQRKERKKAKKDPTWKSKGEKGARIPNSFPYKEQLLADIEEQKKRKAEEEARKREERRLAKKAKAEATEGQEDESPEEDIEDEDDDMMDDSDLENNGNSAMAALLASAKSRAEQYEAQHDSEVDSDFDISDDETPQVDFSRADDLRTRHSKDGSRKQFDKIYKEVLDAADVILYVLDARDPEGTRSRTIEREIMAASATSEKRLILILNKVDLVPPSALKGWLTYLRRYFPTLPLKAAKTAAPGAHTFNHKNMTATGTATALLKALKTYASTKQMKGRVSIGVLGFPNVGKSSVINALTSRVGGSATACPTGAEAGVTTSLREIKLDKRLRLLDSPGIVFPSQTTSKATKAENTANLVLLSALPLKQVDDPISAVQLLLKRLAQSKILFEAIMNVYGLPPLNTNTSIANLTKEFLIQVARKRGRLGKGGIPNVESAAMAVLMDWRDGRIRGWVEPPTVSGVFSDKEHGWTTELIQEKPADVQVVGEWAKEFKIEGLWGDDSAGDGLENPDEMMMD